MSGGLRDPWGDGSGEISGVLVSGTGVGTSSAGGTGLSGLTGVADETGADAADGDDDHDPDEVTVQLDSPPGGSRGNGPDASEVPVFVDESGRRSRTFRRIGIAVGLACAAYAVVIVGTLLSGNSSAPWLPVPGPKDDEPARQVDTTPQPSASSGGGTSDPEVAAPDRPGSTASGTASASPAASASPSARGSAAPPSASASPGPTASASVLRPSPTASSREPSPQAPSSPAASSAPPPPSPSASASPSPDTSPSPAGGAGTTVAGGAPQPAPAHDTSTTRTTTSSATPPGIGALTALLPQAVTALHRAPTPNPAVAAPVLVSAARPYSPVPGSPATVPVLAAVPGSVTTAPPSAPRYAALPGGHAV
ncbi:hypothetical protein ABZ330_22705 [Streptomyces sp. NPDC006172]|uniref:hypothetical protein n=1 Tax=Streptomyces sp. NPDC006172 TaxID=3154470 RepID=UPI0033D17093